MRRSESSGWGAAFLLATAWAVLPLAADLGAHRIPGSPYTDLYPSVWGLGWFAAHQPGLPTFTASLAAPVGMPFYYSSPLHGWVGTPFVGLGGAVLAYTTTLILARFATVACAFGALRAAGLGPTGALVGAAVYGASPFFQGFAVEGIVEGTDGWPLPLWAWMVWRERRAAAAVALALAVVASWYHGLVVCLLAAGWGLTRRTAWLSLGGLMLTVPFVWAFAGAAGGATPLADDVRRAMGAAFTIATPASLDPAPGGNPFARTTWVGLLAPLLALGGRRRGWWAAVLVCGALSVGWGPAYHLPVLEHVRFPYRWHAGTLFGLAVLAGEGADRVGRRLLAPLVVAEGWLLSPIEPWIPAAPADVPPLYDHVRGPVLLEVPGPVALPPGRINPSRPRARYLLYYQLHHGAASPWAPDFNGIAATPPAPWLASFASWDPVIHADPVAPDVPAARAAGVTQVLVHRDELRDRAPGLEAALRDAGARLVADAPDLALFDLDAPHDRAPEPP